MKKLFLLPLALAGVPVLLVSCGATRIGYETADYRLKENARGFELREYPAMTVAATRAKSNGRDERFMRLFRYISGSNEERKKIAMTTPVFMDRAEERQEMMFVLPAKLEKSAPKAIGEAVEVKRVPARTMAVLRYNGSDSRERERGMEDKLRGLLKKAGLKPSGGSLFAYYDPPWTPGFARRNEVLIPVER